MITSKTYHTEIDAIPYQATTQFHCGADNKRNPTITQSMVTKDHG